MAGLLPGFFMLIIMNRNSRLFFLQERLKLYLQAEQAILAGQSYKAEGLELERANLQAVQAMIAKLTREIDALSQNNRRSRIRTVVPIDFVNRSKR